MPKPLPTDALGLRDELLTEPERAKLDELAALLESTARPHLEWWWERAHSPVELRTTLARLRLEDDPAILGADGAPSLAYLGFKHFEFQRFDASIGTLYGGNVGMFRTVLRGGADPARFAALEPDILSFATTGCFALTEPEHGSDVARGLATVATRVGDEWRIDGHKRWIGNASVSDHALVVARDVADDVVRVFLVPTGAPGVTITDIPGKVALRMVRNGDISLRDVRVPDEARLPRINGFGDLARVLAELRYVIAWNAAGLQAGAYEAALRHATDDSSGRPAAREQGVQERLARMLGNVTATLALAARLTERRRAGALTGELAALAKAWIATQTRETVAIGREVAGLDGLLVGGGTARAFCDAEAVYTYEGTHEMNSLIVGRALTGVSAFVPR